MTNDCAMKHASMRSDSSLTHVADIGECNHSSAYVLYCKEICVIPATTFKFITAKLSEIAVQGLVCNNRAGGFPSV